LVDLLIALTEDRSTYRGQPRFIHRGSR